MTIGKLAAVSVIRDRTLAITWDDGHTGIVDVSASIDRVSALEPLGDPAVFAQASVSHDGWSVEWPGGLDFGTGQLRRWADEQAGDTMRAAAFRDWMDRHNLTLDSAAGALGLSRRIIAYYLSGEHPIPKTVMLATEGFDHRKAA